MSLPVTLFKCSVCDFSWVAAMAWGTREYMLTNGLRLGSRRQFVQALGLSNALHHRIDRPRRGGLLVDYFVDSPVRRLRMANAGRGGGAGAGQPSTA